MGELLSGVPIGVLAVRQKCNFMSWNIITILFFWPKSYPSCLGGRGDFDTTEKWTFDHRILKMEVTPIPCEVFKKIQKNLTVLGEIITFGESPHVDHNIDETVYYDGH